MPIDMSAVATVAPGTVTRPVALVTGAAGGLGGAIVRQMAQRGFDLILNDLNTNETMLALQREVAGLGSRAELLAQDISDVATLDGFVDRAFALFGHVDCLINNAGVSVLSRGDILDVGTDSFDRCISIMMRGTFFLSQKIARAMMERGANPPDLPRQSIVTITSIAVNMPGRDIAEYSMVKSALADMVRLLAVRLADEGIDCYDVRPGMMRTDMTSVARGKYDRLIEEGFVPARRWGAVDEIGRVVATLASGEMPYTVGLVVPVDGGMRLKAF